MFRYWLILGIAVSAFARPETYKENEEFNYARSSTDEGSKKGFYEAQRGNVGGNFERAHNMDVVAQGQMSDAINQAGANVDEVAKSNHGNLYSQAYTSGIYGQRRVDTRNLAGRNFDDNAYESGASNFHSSRYQQGYRARDNLHDCSECIYKAETLPSAYESSHSSAYGASNHHSSSTFGHNLNSDVDRYRVVPVKIVARPLTPVNIGVQAGVAEHSADSTYARHEQESRIDSQNSLSHNGDRIYVSAPSSGLAHEKHYESSYKKEWEKHSEVTPVPLAIPVYNEESVNTYNQNHRQNQYRQSLVSDIESGTKNSYNHGAGIRENGYESAYNSGYQRVAEPVNNHYVVLSATPEFVATSTKQGAQSSQHVSTNTAGSRSHSQSAYADESLTQGHLSTNSDNLLARHNHEALADLTHKSETTLPDPKSYQSSYSYHKSWERQGDPYVIKPASPVRSEELNSYNNRYASSNSRYTHGSQDDCDHDGHQRHIRSATIEHHVDSQSKTEEDIEQAIFYGQNMEDFTHQTEELGQEFEAIKKLKGQLTEDMGQQTKKSGQYKLPLGQENESVGQ